MGSRNLNIGSALKAEQEVRLKKLMEKISNLLAWKIKDVPSIDPNLISQKLAINLGATPVVQARRRIGEENYKAI